MKLHVIFGLLMLSTFPALAEPLFSDFPANEPFQGEAVHPDYTAGAAMYRTMIQRGVEGGANAGGHYAIIMIGCGTSCSVIEMVDLRDGRLLEFPVGGEEYYQLAVGYRLDSRLIIVDWKDASDGQFNICVRRFYEIVEGDFIRLEESRRVVEDYATCGTE